MDTLLANAAWPIVVVIIVVTALVLFRSEIAAILDRSHKVSVPGLGSIESSPQTPPSEGAQEEVERKFKQVESDQDLSSTKVVVREGYATVIYENVRRDFPNDEDRVRFLCNFAALENRDKWFEVVYRSIFGSQMRFLYDLNAGERPSYEQARQRFDSIKVAVGLADVPFENWMGFLIHFGMVVIIDAMYTITPMGREFLTYTVRNGYIQTKQH